MWGFLGLLLATALDYGLELLGVKPQGPGCHSGIRSGCWERLRVFSDLRHITGAIQPVPQKMKPRLIHRFLIGLFSFYCG